MVVAILGDEEWLVPKKGGLAAMAVTSCLASIYSSHLDKKTNQPRYPQHVAGLHRRWLRLVKAPSSSRQSCCNEVPQAWSLGRSQQPSQRATAAATSSHFSMHIKKGSRKCFKVLRFKKLVSHHLHSNRHACSESSTKLLPGGISSNEILTVDDSSRQTMAAPDVDP